MYGLVNQAIQEMVIEKFGEPTWEQIREKAGADDIFVAMDQYPDEVTIGLVGAACEVLGASAPDILHAFGDYWVNFTGKTYGNLFEMSGRTFVEMVRNLNTLHTRVGQMMPELKPPSFRVTDEKDGSFVLHYHSSRPGLYPMIGGLMEGLGKRFNTEVGVTHLRGVTDDHDHDEFLVTYRPL
jgi:hypothetical protein